MSDQKPQDLGDAASTPDSRPEENCYCGGPEEIYPHRFGTGRYCKERVKAVEAEKSSDTP